MLLHHQRAVVLLGFICFASVASAGDAWTQFRGPGQQGWSDAKNVPLTWSETEHVKWKTELPGEGWSSPVVTNGQVWMTAALEEGHSLHLLCVDFATGKILRDSEVFHNEVVPPKHDRNSYASPTPIIDGDRIYVHFGTMGTAALDAKTGAKIWENRDLKVDHQNGPGGSATLCDGKLLITCDGIDVQYECALDKATGKMVWKTERSATPKLEKRPPDMRKAYSTPATVRVDGREETISSGAERVYAYDPANGKELWYVDIPGFSNVSTPVWDDKILVTATGFAKHQIWGIRLGGAQGNATESHVLWKQNAGAPAQTSPLLINDRVFMVNDGGIATCLNAATGQIVWKNRIGSDFAASPIFVAGRIYFFDTKGLCTVISPSDNFQVLAKNQLDGGFMASPAVIGDSLVLRTKTSLYRIE